MLLRIRLGEVRKSVMEEMAFMLDLGVGLRMLTDEMEGRNFQKD